ncbi:Telomerase protein component 1 [Balamuthia mandrillaris]
MEKTAKKGLTQIRTLVSGDKRRVRDETLDLDLDFTYVAPRIIAMGFPAEALLEQAYRNRIEEVSMYLEREHAGHYLVFNTSEKHYDPNHFRNHVVFIGWPDHHAPPLHRQLRLCERMLDWLEGDSRNTAVIHCKAGKGRTGTAISSYFLYCGMYDHPAEAMYHFAIKRSASANGVTVPSQIRYVKYLSKLLKGKMPTQVLRTPRQLYITKIILEPIADVDMVKGGIFPRVEVLYMDPLKAVHIPICMIKAGRRYKSKWDRNVVIDMERVLVEGDILIRIFNKRDLIVGTDMQLLFKYAFHTSFIRSNMVLECPYSALDGPGAGRLKNKSFPEGFVVRTFFEDASRCGIPPKHPLKNERYKHETSEFQSWRAARLAENAKLDGETLVGRNVWRVKGQRRSKKESSFAPSPIAPTFDENEWDSYDADDYDSAAINQVNDFGYRRNEGEFAEKAVEEAVRLSRLEEERRRNEAEQLFDALVISSRTGGSSSPIQNGSGMLHSAPPPKHMPPASAPSASASFNPFVDETTPSPIHYPHSHQPSSSPALLDHAGYQHRQQPHASKVYPGPMPTLVPPPSAAHSRPQRSRSAPPAALDGQLVSLPSATTNALSPRSQQQQQQQLHHSSPSPPLSHSTSSFTPSSSSSPSSSTSAAAYLDVLSTIQFPSPSSSSVPPSHHQAYYTSSNGASYSQQHSYPTHSSSQPPQHLYSPQHQPQHHQHAYSQPQLHYPQQHQQNYQQQYQPTNNHNTLDHSFSGTQNHRTLPPIPVVTNNNKASPSSSSSSYSSSYHRT